MFKQIVSKQWSPKQRSPKQQEPEQWARKSLLHSLCAFSLVVCATAGAAEISIDPTRPSGSHVSATVSTKTQSKNALRLTMVRLGPQPLAIINGQTLRPGDTVAGMRVQSIHAGRVVLSGNQGQRTLALLPSLRMNAPSSSPSSTPILKRRPTL